LMHWCWMAEKQVFSEKHSYFYILRYFTFFNTIILSLYYKCSLKIKISDYQLHINKMSVFTVF